MQRLIRRGPSDTTRRLRRFAALTEAGGLVAVRITLRGSLRSYAGACRGASAPVVVGPRGVGGSGDTATRVLGRLALLFLIPIGAGHWRSRHAGTAADMVTGVAPDGSASQPRPITDSASHAAYWYAAKTVMLGMRTVRLVILMVCVSLFGRAAASQGPPSTDELPTREETKRGFDKLVGRYDGVIAAAPSFGGVYIDGHRTFVLLRDPAQLSAAEQALRSASLLGLGARDAPFEAVRCRYTYAELTEWRARLNGVFEVVGVQSVAINDRANQISVGIVDPDAREIVAEEVAAAQVPPAAVWIRDEPRTVLLGIPHPPDVERRLLIKVSAPRKMRVGDSIDLVAMARNVGKTPLEVGVWGDPPMTFEVVDRRLRRAWLSRWPCGREPTPGNGLRTHMLPSLAPGEAHRFVVRWDGRDEKCRPLPPGIYKVRAYLGIAGRGGIRAEKAARIELVE